MSTFPLAQELLDGTGLVNAVFGQTFVKIPIMRNRVSAKLKTIQKLRLQQDGQKHLTQSLGVAAQLNGGPSQLKILLQLFVAGFTT